MSRKRKNKDKHKRAKNEAFGCQPILPVVLNASLQSPLLGLPNVESVRLEFVPDDQRSAGQGCIIFAKLLRRRHWPSVHFMFDDRYSYTPCFNRDALKKFWLNVRQVAGGRNDLRPFRGGVWRSFIRPLR